MSSLGRIPTALKLGTLAALLLAPLAASAANTSLTPLPESPSTSRKDTPAQPPKNTAPQVGRDASGRPVLLMDGQPEALNPAVLLWDGPAYAKVFAKAELDQLVVWVKLSSIRDEAPHIKQENHLPVFWRGCKDYEPAMVNSLLDPIRTVHPRAKLILWLEVTDRNLLFRPARPRVTGRRGMVGVQSCGSKLLTGICFSAPPAHESPVGVG
jgi:hypothetical protein